MAVKKRKVAMAKVGPKRNRNGTYTISNEAELKSALNRVDELQEQIAPLEHEAGALKTAATKYADGKNIDVVQLDGRYYRRIQRASRRWVGIEDDMPNKAPASARPLSKLVKGKWVTQNGKRVPLWNLLTRRIPDPERIDAATRQGIIDLKDIEAAYVEIPQQVFYQRFSGEVDAY
jgi:hypothetical protein